MVRHAHEDGIADDEEHHRPVELAPDHDLANEYQITTKFLLNYRPDTVMVSVMAVNNEIGVYQPLKARMI